MRISDWSSDVCSSDLGPGRACSRGGTLAGPGGPIGRTRPMTPLHTLAALTVIILWGVNSPIGKLGLEQLPPLTLLALRFSLVALLLVPFARRPAGRVSETAMLRFTLVLIHFPRPAETQ